MARIIRKVDVHDRIVVVGGDDAAAETALVLSERLGLRAGEQEILKNWLNPPGAVAEVLNGGEQALYRELLTRTGTHRRERAIGPHLLYLIE